MGITVIPQVVTGRFLRIVASFHSFTLEGKPAKAVKQQPAPLETR